MSDNNEYSLFLKYKQTRNIETRNEIVLKYMHVVKVITISLRNMYTGYIDTEDIINEGVLGLMTAIDAFETERGLKFETYASVRIRGAIIDYIRKQDWIPRSVRKQAKEIEETYTKLYHLFNRTPTNNELAEDMGVTEEKLLKIMSDVAGALTLSFEELIYEDNFNMGADSSGDNVWSTERNLLDKELRDMLAMAIDTLPDREKLIIALYYHERLKFSDIAKILDVTDSRVCQIHSKAILLLRNKLKDYLY